MKSVGNHPRIPATERPRMGVWIHAKGGTSLSVFLHITKEGAYFTKF